MQFSLLTLLVPGLLATFCHGQCISENDKVLVGKIDNSLNNIADFGLDLFKELFPHNTDQNFFFSLYSVWSALTLAYFGSSGNTEAELKEVLNHKDKVSAIASWRSIDFMYEMRQKNKTDYILKIANHAYFDKSVPLRPCMQAIFNKEIEVIDLIANPAGSAKTINNWVSNITNNRIQKIVTQEDMSNVNMALVNAAFFMGSWLYPFKESKTRKELFYMSKDQYTFVDMMTQTGNFRYGVSSDIGAYVLELPYAGEAVSMYIFLPPYVSDQQGLQSIVNRINSTTLQNAIFDIHLQKFELTIPKFKFEMEIQDELITTLRKMGINDLFDSNVSDLSSFSPNGSLSISKAVHKAGFEVNEEGSEAYASTVLLSSRNSRPVGPEKIVCNHPFLFIIYDNLAENILFMGAYKNPKA